MKIIYDKGKQFGKYRFLKLSSKKQLDIDDEDFIIIILGLITCTMLYSFKHKCWISKIFKN